MYSNETYENIRKRCLDRINNGLDKREGSFNSDMVSPACMEIAIMYTKLQDIINTGFIVTNFNNELDARIKEAGMVRKEGLKATGELKVYGEPNVHIPNGTIFVCNDLRFIMLNDVFIGQDDDICYVEALEVGEQYNIWSGAEFNMVGQIEGFNYVICEKEFKGGVNVESDEAFRERYFDFISNVPTSGNVAHYRQWALEVDGVERAIVYPRHNGNGTVKVLAIGIDNTPIDDELLTTVREHIEESMPISDIILTVVTPTRLNLNITATIELNEEETLESINEQFKRQFLEYIKTVDSEVVYVKVFGILAKLEGVNDITSFKINNSTNNITITEDYIPDLGDIQISEVE